MTFEQPRFGEPFLDMATFPVPPKDCFWKIIQYNQIFWLGLYQKRQYRYFFGLLSATEDVEIDRREVIWDGSIIELAAKAIVADLEFKRTQKNLIETFNKNQDMR